MEQLVSTTPIGNTAARVDSDRLATATTPRPWRLNTLRAGYLFIVAGTAATQWPMLVSHGPAWPLMEGVKTSNARSGVNPGPPRSPLPAADAAGTAVRGAWKAVRAAAVAWPLWPADRLDSATRQVASDCLWVVIVIAAIPWRYVLAEYVVKRGERWRSR